MRENVIFIESAALRPKQGLTMVLWFSTIEDSCKTHSRTSQPYASRAPTELFLGGAVSDFPVLRCWRFMRMHRPECQSLNMTAFPPRVHDIAFLQCWLETMVHWLNSSHLKSMILYPRSICCFCDDFYATVRDGHCAPLLFTLPAALDLVKRICRSLQKPLSEYDASMFVQQGYCLWWWIFAKRPKGSTKASKWLFQHIWGCHLPTWCEIER